MELVRQRERSRALVAVVCVLLIALTAFLEAAHFHSSRQSEQHCSVCVVAQHSAAAPAAAHVAAQSFVFVSLLAPVAPQAVSFLGTFAFFIRPPPSH
jgi:hypothetical protein